MSRLTVIYPGTFDPPTNGHLDLIARGAKMADELVIAVLQHSIKAGALFTSEEREAMLQECVVDLPNVRVAIFDGLLVEFARAQGAQAVLRGIRAVSDYEYELQMALMNRKLASDIETIFLIPAEKYTFVSSRLVKGVAKLGGDVSELVPPHVNQRLIAKAQTREMGSAEDPVALAE